MAIAVAQLLLLLASLGVGWYGIEATSGKLITCDDPWTPMRPDETCTDRDDDSNTTTTYTYEQWKPVMESHAAVLVIFGVLGVGFSLGWAGFTTAQRALAKWSPPKARSLPPEVDE